MKSDLFSKMEETFYEYTKKYDQNIKSLIKDRGVELSIEELEEILHDAKMMITERGSF